MKQIRKIIKKLHSGLDMKFKSTIKLKALLLVTMPVLLSTFLMYNFSKDYYLYSNEKHLKTYLSSLLTQIGEDADHIEKSLDWVLSNLNLTIYVRDDVESFLADVPSYVDKKKVLSDSDLQQLKSGNTIINKIKTHDFGLDVSLFIHPIIENNKIEKILLLHAFSNSMIGNEEVFASQTILFAILFVGLLIFIYQIIFKKSWNKFDDIKLATIEVSKGNFDAKIHDSSRDELGELTELFNAMSTKLKDEQNRTKEFMEDFSHEVKTPLTLVKNYNQALLNNMIQTPEEQRNCYHLIDREMNRMQRLIQNFLDFTKLDAQAVELVKQPIVFAQNVEEIVSKYELVFKENNVTLDMKLDYDVIILADEDRLEQIIQNIIQNAIRYAKDEPYIRITMETKENTCVLAIADNGVGISEENLAIITNRFIRVNKVRSRKEAGTGLGLSIVEKLMELHGGKLSIESQLGEGTTIKLEFPILFD